MKLFTDVSFPTEIQDVAKLFFADVLLCSPEQAECSLTHTCADGVYTYVAQALGQSAVRSVSTEGDGLQSVRLQKRYAKLAMYEALCRGTGKSMPWGSLTGIRPTRLACQLQSEGADWQKTFVELLGVSPEKTALTADILQCQKGLRDYREGCADLYVGIPFCVSRCSYCSFTGGEIGKMQKYVQPYVDVLRREVRETVQFARSRGIKLNNVYFGGGTPTSLSARQLEDVLSEITFAPVEFTVEAGRPDTIDGEKLRVLKDHGVHRISVNPQTFNQSVLDAVGRRHTVQAIYDSFGMAKEAGFAVNMDLIAGLPTETYEMFRHSVDCAVGLQPENLTVHTLALKHGTALKEQRYATDGDVEKMVEYAHSQARAQGYLPYYMYRQKYMSQNLENVGFCKEGRQCLYNIGMMEEVTDILACGANAISKKISAAENRIERAANAKDVITYVQRIDDYMQKKFALFEA